MKSGKIIVMVFIVLASAIGLATLQELGYDENNSANIDDFFSQAKTVKIKISDDVGSKLFSFG